MARFALKDKSGNVLAIAEAADKIDAEVYGVRDIRGFAGAEPYTETAGDAVRTYDALKEVGRSWGHLSEAAAETFARGRDGGRDYGPRVINVPPQPSNLRALYPSVGSSTPAVRPLAEHTPPASTSSNIIELRETSESDLAESFKRLGLDDRSAAVAAKGRD